MSAAIDIHYWITGFAYPAINLFTLGISIWGFLRTRYGYQFALIGASSALSVLISSVFLILKIQKAADVSIISKQLSRTIWPAQAIGEYLSMGLYAVGFLWLIYSMIQTENQKS